MSFKSKHILPKLTIPEVKPEDILIQNVWVPNPDTSKFTSVYSTASPQSADSSIYCSQCQRYFNNPTIFYQHINRC
ncbi:hypothetical protein EC988_002081 [Linderina pennispora]|nr:hypothetical protein EC988_002081 [Linderina pennispora]